MQRRTRSVSCGGSAVAVHREGRQHPCPGAEADPHGPDCSEDFGDDI